MPIRFANGKLTIGVAAHGNVDVTIECLKSVFESASGEFDLILVDDASPDNMLELFWEAKAFHKRTRIFRFPENKEYSHSVNCILAHAQTDFTLFVSNDIFITPTYLTALLEVINDSENGIVRGVSNFVDGYLDSDVHIVREIDEIATLDQLFDFAAKIFNSGRPIQTHDIFLTGDAFMVRAETLRKIGGFDTRFGGYMSDIDFGIRAAKAGFKRTVCGKGFAWHAQDANISYLSNEQRERKLALRCARVDMAWKSFRGKWGLTDLPDTWQPTLLRDIPFARLDSLSFALDTDREPMHDYTPHLIIDLP